MSRSREAGRRRGRPTALTPAVADRIVDAVACGNHLTTACAAAGISRSTLYRWLEKAAVVDESIGAGERCSREALAFCDFRDRLALARARAELDAVKVIQRAMRGGEVIRQAPARDRQGRVLLGADGEPVYVNTYSAPDGRLALAFLARSSPEKWGRTVSSSFPSPDVTSADVRSNSRPSRDTYVRLSRRLLQVVAERGSEAET
jgi:hypothetical protein